MGNMIEDLSTMDIDSLEEEINKERKRLDAMIKLLNIRKSLGETTRHMRVARARAAMKREAAQKEQVQQQVKTPVPQQPQQQVQRQVRPQTSAATTVRQSSPVVNRPDPGKIVREIFGDDEQPTNGNGPRVY